MSRQPLRIAAPTLTVAITTYNRWAKCERAFDSILGQTESRIEILLVDDCSPLLIPPRFAKKITDAGAQYYRHTVNRGLAAARNTAIKNAEGRFFSFCDDDDLWLADAATKLLTPLRAADSTATIAIALPSAGESCFKGRRELSLRELMLLGVTPPVAAQLYKTELIREVGGYDESVRSGVDHDLWISLVSNNPCVGIVLENCSSVDDDPFAERITTAEASRRAEIKRSLSIWRGKIETVFGADFYQHFCKSYEEYLNLTFLIQAMKRGSVGEAFAKALEQPRTIWQLFLLARRRFAMGRVCSTFKPFTSERIELRP